MERFRPARHGTVPARRIRLREKFGNNWKRLMSEIELTRKHSGALSDHRITCGAAPHSNRRPAPRGRRPHAGLAGRHRCGRVPINRAVGTCWSRPLRICRRAVRLTTKVRSCTPSPRDSRRPRGPTPYTLHAHHRRAFAGPNSWPRHHSSFPDSAHLPGTANAAPRLSRPPSHTFLAIVLALAPLLQTSEMHHDDREMSALGPGTDQLVTIPIPLRQRRSVGCFTYPPMWTRPADRAPSCGPCGQAMEKLTLPHRLPTLGALAPTSSPLLQQRFMEKATAPAPAGSRITPSSQEIRLRNTPTNSRGDPTRECEKQQHVAGTDRLRYFTARVSGKLDPGAPGPATRSISRRSPPFLKSKSTTGVSSQRRRGGRSPTFRSPVGGSTRRVRSRCPRATTGWSAYAPRRCRSATIRTGGGTRTPVPRAQDAAPRCRGRRVPYHGRERIGREPRGHLLNDAWKELLDAAVVISNDTDQVVPVRMVTQERKRPVFVVCPGRWQIAPQSG